MSYSTADKEFFDGKPRPTIFQQQGDAVINQAAPVINTYYTVLETTNTRIIRMCCSVADTDETLNFRFTIDGNVIVTDAVAPGIGVHEFPHNNMPGGVGNSNWGLSNGVGANPAYSFGAFLFECRTAKIEVRKTTANGVGVLSARVQYARIP